MGLGCDLLHLLAIGMMCTFYSMVMALVPALFPHVSMAHWVVRKKVQAAAYLNETLNEALW